jgi:hypothetical protein
MKIDMSHRKRRKKDGLRLTDKKHPIQGIWSAILGFLSVILFLVLCVMSGAAGGASGIEIGFLGFLCAAVSVFGFVLAMLSLRLENIRQFFPSVGVVTNGLMILLYLLVYIVGMG